MRSLLLAATVLALAGAGPSFAQQPAAAAAPEPAAAAAPTHEDCKSVMGRKMDGKALHDHGAEKGAPATNPKRKALTPAEMEKMHAKCAAKMAEPAKK